MHSDTSSRALALTGNVFTRYGWNYVTVETRVAGARYEVRTPSLHLVARLDRGALPPDSPFTDLDDARRFAGPMPYTFEHEPETSSLVVVRGNRDRWTPRPVEVDVIRCDFCTGGTLASAFVVEDVEYRWNRGRREKIAR